MVGAVVVEYYGIFGSSKNIEGLIAEYLQLVTLNGYCRGWGIVIVKDIRRRITTNTTSPRIHPWLNPKVKF